MGNLTKRWFEFALDEAQKQLDFIPTDKTKLHETLRKSSSNVTHPLLRIDSLLNLIVAARHEIPPDAKAAVDARILAIRAELKRLIARVKSLGNEVN